MYYCTGPEKANIINKGDASWRRHAKRRASGLIKPQSHNLRVCGTIVYVGDSGGRNVFAIEVNAAIGRLHCDALLHQMQYHSP